MDIYFYPRNYYFLILNSLKRIFLKAVFFFPFKEKHSQTFLKINLVSIVKWKWSRSVVSNNLRSHGLVAYQAPPSMGFSRQKYWDGLPFPSPGALPNPGIKPGPPTSQADTLTYESPGKPCKLNCKFFILGKQNCVICQVTWLL